MPYFVLYTALLLLAAFLAGAWLACMTRKLFGWRPPSRRAVLAGAGASAGALAGRAPRESGSIFGPRGAEEQAILDRLASQDDPAGAVAEPEPELEAPVVTEAPEPEIEVEAPVEADAAPVVEHVTEEPAGERIEEAPTVGVEAARPESMPEILPSPDAEPFAPMAETHSDDASAMAAVADPVPEEPEVSVPVEDVEVVDVPAVDFGTVEEPALPEETSGETYRAAVVAGLATAAAASLASQDAPETSAMPAAGELAAGEPADDLTRIRGIDQDTEAKLNEAGVFRFDQLSRLAADDVSSLHGAIGSSSRISREGWIEQATILERGEETYFSRRQHQQAPKSNPETPST
ncbi:MAG: hypothetical protein ACR2O4_11500, partial [Hyphomicrobiaceae bacterium]